MAVWMIFTGPLIQMNVTDGTGEYLIFSGTEEWSRLLISLGEAPPEATDT